jgi:hypothetical protein
LGFGFGAATAQVDEAFLDPRSLTYEQLERPVSFNLADVLTGA